MVEPITETPPVTPPETPPVTPPVETPPETPPVEAWHKGFGEDAGKDEDVTRYKTAEEFYKGFKERGEALGKKGIIVPDANATPEQREKFLNDLGRPTAPGEYKLDAVEGLHESIKVTPETTTHFNGEMHKIGLTNEQANAVNKMQMSFVDQAVKAQETAEKEAATTAETALRAEWKGDYDVNRANVARLITKAGGQEAIDAMGGVDGLGNNPVVLKALGVIAGMLSEDQINSIRSPIGQEGGNETVEEAKAKIAEIQKVGSDDYKALMDPDHVNHKAIVAERDRLFKKQFPTGGA